MKPAYIAAGAAALLVVGSGVWWAVRPATASLPTPTAAERQLAADFLAKIRAGQVDAAWDGTSAEFKSYMGRDTFRAFVKKHPALKGPAEFADGKVTTRNEVPVAEYTFQAGGAKPATITVNLAVEGGVWKVERIAVE